MNNSISKKLILKRIKELYQHLEEECSDNYFTSRDITKSILKVLVDIYTDDGNDDHRLIYHGWDVIEPTIELILEKEGKQNESN